MSLNCLAITLTAGVILKEEKKSLSCGGETVWEAFLGDDLVARVIASQNCLETIFETIFALGHQDVSQGPLGFFCELRYRGAKNCESQVEAVRTNRSHVMKIGVFLRIDSPGHLSRVVGQLGSLEKPLYFRNEKKSTNPNF